MAVILLAIIGISIWILASNLDNIVKRVVEEVGSDTLGTKVSLSSATISLGDASAVLSGLKIANPPDFVKKDAFNLGAIEVSIDPASAASDEIVIPEIIVDQATLHFEQQGGKNNLQIMMDNIKSEPEEPTDDNTTGIRFVIKEFQLKDAGMTLSHEQLGQEISFTLPDIVLHNIGREGAGVTAEEAARQILEPVIDRVMDASKDRAKQEIEALAKKELNKQTDKALNSVRDKLFGQ